MSSGFGILESGPPPSGARICALEEFPWLSLQNQCPVEEAERALADARSAHAKLADRLGNAELALADKRAANERLAVISSKLHIFFSGNSLKSDRNKVYASAGLWQGRMTPMSDGKQQDRGCAPGPSMAEDDHPPRTLFRRA